MPPRRRVVAPAMSWDASHDEPPEKIRKIPRIPVRGDPSELTSHVSMSSSSQASSSSSQGPSIAIQGLTSPKTLQSCQLMTSPTSSVTAPTSSRSTSSQGAASTSSSTLDVHGSAIVTPGRQPRASTRKQAPPVYNKVRGSKQRAFEIARDPVARAQALAEYERDARSAGDTTKHNVTTWKEFHDAWWAYLGMEVEVFPLTVASITAVGTLLKGADYRSAYNYIAQPRVSI